MSENPQRGNNSMQINYDKSCILSKCENTIVEAKRVLLNEELDKIVNITLSGMDQSTQCKNRFKRCTDSLYTKDENFLENLPKLTHPTSYVNNYCVTNNVFISGTLHVNQDNPLEQKLEVSKSNSVAKYFKIWKEKVKNKKVQPLENEICVNQVIKLDTFIKEIKKSKKQKIKYPKKQTPREILTSTKSYDIYKNRFIAQKNIIDTQKLKLEEQNKIIDELQLGVIRKDLLKSLENTRISIHEIFGNCSRKVKFKVPLLLLEENEKFMVNIQKAPKIIQQMEQRAIQRAQNRQIILERKRLIEEARQKLLEEAIENKRVIEEEERKKNLELITEMRKKELEKEKIRHALRERYLKNLEKAINFYNKVLIKTCFNELYKNLMKSKDNDQLAREHYKKRIYKEVLTIGAN